MIADHPTPTAHTVHIHQTVYVSQYELLLTSVSVYPNTSSFSEQLLAVLPVLLYRTYNYIF